MPKMEIQPNVSTGYCLCFPVCMFRYEEVEVRKKLEEKERQEEKKRREDKVEKDGGRASPKGGKEIKKVGP